MDATEFEQRLINETALRIPAELKRDVARRFTSVGRTGNMDLREAKQEVWTAQGEQGPGELRSETEDPNYVVVPLPHRDETDATRALMEEALRPWVEEVRQRIFGCTSPPFESEDDACEWLRGAERLSREAHERERARVETGSDRAFELEERIWEMTAEIEELNFARFDIAYRPESAMMQTSDHKIVGAFVGPTAGAFYTFALEMRRMSETTSGPSDHLSRHVLLGEKLELPSVRFTRGISHAKGGEYFTTKWVDIRIMAPVTYEDLRTIHAAIRDYWPEAYDDTPSRRLLRNLVRDEMGENVGSDWSESSWRSVAERWEAVGMPRQEWRTLMMRYRRFQPATEATN